MSRRIEQFALAKIDIARILDYLLEQRASSAARFLTALEQTYELLRDNAEIGVPLESDIERLAGVRIWPVKRFRKYLIFYRPHKEKIQILRVIHGSRDYMKLLEE